MLGCLSWTLNYEPDKLIDEPVLCNKLKNHEMHFLIEVSSDKRYWNSRESGYDQFFAMQLADIKNLGLYPVVIPNKEDYPKESKDITSVLENTLPYNYFPPFVVYKREGPNVFECIKEKGDTILKCLIEKKKK